MNVTLKDIADAFAIAQMAVKQLAMRLQQGANLPDVQMSLPPKLVFWESVTPLSTQTIQSHTP